jgi:hypothetical protein
MKIKLIALVLLGAGVIAVGLVRTAVTTQKKSPPYEDRLKWYVKEAKSEGRQKIRIPFDDVIEYLGGAGTITAEEAFSSMTVVIAHLAAKESYPRNDNISTWNKFVIDEVLSEAKELPCTTCGSSDPPATLLPLQQGEFLISKAGGRVNIDGVEIEQIDETYPPYEFNQKYLLLIHLNPTGTAWTIGGPVGVFRVAGNDKVLPVRESNHRVHKDFKEKHGNSLEQLRKHLKHK